MPWKTHFKKVGFLLNCRRIQDQSGSIDGPSSIWGEKINNISSHKMSNTLIKRKESQEHLKSWCNATSLIIAHVIRYNFTWHRSKYNSRTPRSMKLQENETNGKTVTMRMCWNHVRLKKKKNINHTNIRNESGRLCQIVWNWAHGESTKKMDWGDLHC